MALTVIDRDVRLLVVTIVFAGMISYIAQMLWRGLRLTRGETALVVLVAAAVGGIGYLRALVLRFAISRRREYLADAGSVELTKNPEALISALRKIAEHPTIPHVPSEVRQMFIENPPAAFGLFATHPPLAKRIERLSEIAGSPIDKTAADNRASLEQAVESLQLQFQASGPDRIKLQAESRTPTAIPATAAPDNGRGLGASDVLIIVIGLVGGAAIAVLFF